MVKAAGKSAVLAFLACAFFIAYSLSAPYFRSWLTDAHGTPSSSVATTALHGFCLALVWGAVFALPLAWLFGRWAHLAALACIAPVVSIAALAYSQQHRPGSTLLATSLFIGSLVVVVPASAQAAYFVLRRLGLALRGNSTMARVRLSSSSDRGA